MSQPQRFPLLSYTEGNQWREENQAEITKVCVVLGCGAISTSQLRDGEEKAVRGEEIVN